MAKNRGFSEEDLINKGFVKNAQGGYSPASKVNTKSNETSKVGNTFTIPPSDYVRKLDKIVFDIKPNPKPRMTQQDTWRVDPNHPDPKKRQRSCVTQYWAFKDALVAQFITKLNLTVPQVIDGLYFIMPMPKGWSHAKRAEMIDQYHEVRPDLDNLLKAFKDCLCKEDSYVAAYKGDGVQKIWGLYGQIIITKPKLWFQKE